MALFTQTASVTRPANTSSYSAGATINTSSAGSQGGVLSLAFPFPSIKVWSVSLTRGTSGGGQYRAHFFSAPPTVGSGDTTSLSITSFTAGTYLGNIAIDMSTSFSSSATAWSNSSTPVAMNLSYASSNTLYVVLAASSTIAGSSTEKFTLTVTAEPLSFQQ